MDNRTLTLVIHGESGVGKSYLADTAPAPRLILDVEGGVRFTPSRKIDWDPIGPPPKPDDTWDTAVVTVTDLDLVRRAFAWLKEGQHPFRSVIIDSLTEEQKRRIDRIAGTEALQRQHYGVLLREGDALVRGFRDLTLHTARPVEVVVFVCATREKGQDHPVVRPALMGQMAEQIGYTVDVMAYLAMGVDAQGNIQRRALFAQIDGIAAKDRTGRLGVTMDSPTIPKMLEKVYGEEESA